MSVILMYCESIIYKKIFIDFPRPVDHNLLLRAGGR